MNPDPLTFRQEVLAQVEQAVIIEWAAKRVLRHFKPLSSLPDAPPQFHPLEFQWAMPCGYPVPKPYKQDGNEP